MEFKHERIDSNPPSMKLGFCLATDITGNGRDDVIVGARGRSYPGRRFVKQIENSPIPTFDDVRYRFGVAEVDLFWYENPGWKRHKMSNVSRLDVGASLGDINSNGRLDVVAGQGIHNNDVYWFEQPEDPRTEWRKHLVTDDFEKYHDLAVGDVDDDGQLELVGLSQESEVVFYYDIPDDPYEAPWPDEDRHIIAEDLDVEGVQIVDIDGDGQTEIIAGTSIFHQPTEPDRPWRREDITTILADVRVAVADLDQDGDLEVVFSEGDLPTYGSHLGRVAWFDPPDWEPTFLKEDLFGPHSLQVADFTGDGRQDVYVGEMALESNDDPKHFIFINQGGGEFEEHVIDHGIATHEAKVADLTGDGRPDIVGKSYGPNHHVDAWYNEG